MAYQFRQEISESPVCPFHGSLHIFLLISIPSVLSYFNVDKHVVVEIYERLHRIIHITAITAQIKKRKQIPIKTVMQSL
jgi:hypothetical protein